MSVEHGNERNWVNICVFDDGYDKNYSVKICETYVKSTIYYLEVWFFNVLEQSYITWGILHSLFQV